LNVSIVIDRQTFYTFDRPEEYFLLNGFHWSSYVCICPSCLSSWAIVQVDKSEIFWSTTVPCANCPWHYPAKPGIPGSLLEQGIHHWIDLDLLNYLPDALVRREFSVYLRELDRNTPMLTPEDLSKLQLYRSRINAGEQIPVEEMKEAMRLLRSDRMQAAQRAQASRAKSSGAKAKAPARSPSELLGKLGIQL
jgi:hypothetical protein